MTNCLVPGVMSTWTRPPDLGGSLKTEGVIWFDERRKFVGRRVAPGPSPPRSGHRPIPDSPTLPITGDRSCPAGRVAHQQDRHLGSETGPAAEIHYCHIQIHTSSHLIYLYNEQQPNVSPPSHTQDADGCQNAIRMASASLS